VIHYYIHLKRSQIVTDSPHRAYGRGGGGGTDEWGRMGDGGDHARLKSSVSHESLPADEK